jgi:hypothetical protein
MGPSLPLRGREKKKSSLAHSYLSHEVGEQGSVRRKRRTGSESPRRG